MTPHFDFFTSATRTALVALDACEEGLERFDASTGMEFPGRLVRDDVEWMLGRESRLILLPPSSARDDAYSAYSVYAYAARARAAAAAAAARDAYLDALDAYLDDLNFQEPTP